MMCQFLRLYLCSVSGSQLLEKIYGKKSQILQNLIDILLLVGDPSVKKEPKPDFPLALLPKQDPCQGKSEFHPVVETVYRMLLRLGQNMIDRPRILELTLSFFENKDTPCYFISKALKCVMKNLLQYDTDVALFVERGKWIHLSRVLPLCLKLFQFKIFMKFVSKTPYWYWQKS